MGESTFENNEICLSENWMARQFHGRLGISLRVFFTCLAYSVA
ncbi:hypothetical protein SAMN04487948_1277 [Halogranum amylolyticum]|uniref:Uncharacterized protein n=1 Tax=Halogranum amylolyticum TaxID=660520 RepID=A0A1H8WC38_9EURY|nr:hypothetical protein SAMN04487948_1277 [Halogranum amylolyticum]